MEWTISDSLDRFEAEAGGFLGADPARNTVPLSVCAALRRRGPDAYGPLPPVFGWWRGSGGAVEAAFLRTPPHPLLLAGGTAESSRALAAGPAGTQDAVRGERQAVLAFAEAWRQRTGGQVVVGRDTRLYRLAELTPRPMTPPGAARTAGPADRALVLRWEAEFARDVGAETPGGEGAVDDALSRGGRVLWELPGGEPVSMAGWTPPADGTSRVVAVYTPAERRGRGYAGAVVAAVSRAAPAAGAGEVVLFTDLADPVSNGLYRKLGYVPVADFAERDLRGAGFSTGDGDGTGGGEISAA